MSEDADDSEKTEEPTPERRQKAREDGQFARARDTGAVAATVAVLLVLNGIWGDLVGVLLVGVWLVHWSPCHFQRISTIATAVRRLVRRW